MRKNVFLLFFACLWMNEAEGAEAQLRRLTTCSGGSAIERVQALDDLIDRAEKVKTTLEDRQQKLRGALPECQKNSNGYTRDLNRIQGDATTHVGKGLDNMEREAKGVASGMKILGADACAQQATKLVADLRRWDSGFTKNLKAMQCK